MGLLLPFLHLPGPLNWIVFLILFSRVSRAIRSSLVGFVQQCKTELGQRGQYVLVGHDAFRVADRSGRVRVQYGEDGL